ncbi:membrane fusion protein, multidrug efflux system [Pricia antarctica]|uniref:Membrane fusion protein, multidrug efflux system n=1 Tax=Pricia antarctica TaxID=641691 RepID=A0A1G7HB27_9FLAO|nr:efflux RND transporter periplasmic adaptor subunit [Pricia antarctica]SDE97657.1 membrane fusion protein, multidrug efflux system [Pricia antarctica]
MKKIIHFRLALLLVAILSLTGCGNGVQEQKPGGAEQNQQTPTFSVTEIPLKTLTAYNTYPASIEGIINSEVRAKVSGYITDVLVDEGQKVRRGQTLFKLETQSLSQDAAAAEANVNAAQVELNKLKPLVEKNIISEVQMETAKAKLQQAKSGYSSIAANIDYANIKSPVDGYVGEIRLRKGSLVSPGNQTPLTRVSDISKVYAYFSMNERDYIEFLRSTEGESIAEVIKKLPKVQLVLPDGSIYEKEGTVETINSQVNAQTGTISFRAIFENPNRLLTNGNSGKIRVPKTYTDAVVVPKTATFERQGSTYVYKVGEDSLATATQIEIEKEVENLYVVSSGLKKDDRIVGKGVAKLRGETKINPQETPFDSIAKPLETVFR